MENSPVCTLIHSFSPVELRDVRKFLQSPFFNQRQDVVEIFEVLAARKLPKKLQFGRIYTPVKHLMIKNSGS